MLIDQTNYFGRRDPLTCGNFLSAKIYLKDGILSEPKLISKLINKADVCFALQFIAFAF